jgi:ribosomal-protein-alanine N-acetyltransferase
VVNELTPATLETARLVLRPFRTGDEPDVFRYGCDPEFAFFATNAPPMTEKDARAFVHRSLSTPWDQCARFAITLQGRVIGNIDLDPDWTDEIADIGYAVAREQWGRGFALRLGVLRSSTRSK